MNIRPVAVSSWYKPTKYFEAFLATAKKNGIEVQNADPSDWGGLDWTKIEWWRKSDAQARFVREHASDYDVFLFTDSYDIVFAAGWDEILAKFQKLDSPIVFGTERYCWPLQEQAALYPPCEFKTRFLNAGMWMATTEYALKMAEILAAKAKEKKQCDSGICVDLFLSKQLPIKLDNACSLLYCCNMDSLDHLDLTGKRPLAKETGMEPCILHGNGASDLSGVIAALNRQ